ncbi:MAG: twin-arginine translocase subunit TatC [Chloroflexi bacterium]|nr:twin-arginine translocase subunit TatC [Chloroflexota bacterium]
MDDDQETPSSAPSDDTSDGRSVVAADPSLVSIDAVASPAPGGPAVASVPNEPALAMSLVDHLAELRNRIVWSLLAIVVGAVAGFVTGEQIIRFLSLPLPSGLTLYYNGIGDPFAIRIRIALVAGVILAMPVILWQVWRFVAPGLTATERRAILPWIPAALVFFTVGVSIAYVILPFAAAFLLAFQTPDLKPLLTAREYFDFVSTMFLAFGLLMEFPILLVGLSRVGIVTSERLRRSRRLIVLVISVFAAIATPGGDIVSPLVLGVTLYVLFEGTIVVIRRSGR